LCVECVDAPDARNAVFECYNRDTAKPLAEVRILIVHVHVHEPHLQGRVWALGHGLTMSGRTTVVARSLNRVSPGAHRVGGAVEHLQAARRGRRGAGSHRQGACWCYE